MTNEQQINRLKEPFRSQAISNCYTHKGGNFAFQFLSKESTSLSCTIYRAFSWVKSPECFEYWDQICDNPQNYTINEQETEKEEN